MDATKTREYGIDVLRILSSFMVIVLHILYYGRLAAIAPPGTTSYYIGYSLGILCNCAVTCFGLISGYIGYDGSYKLSSIVKHQISVVFFTLTITAIISIAVPGITIISSFIKALFPILSSTYWYYTAYAILFFLFPAFNAAINTLKKRQLDFMLVIMLLCLSIIPCILNKDIFHTKNGYSFSWLALLYCIGAYLKKYRNHFKKTPRRYLGVFLFSVLITCIIKFGAEFLILKSSGNSVDFFQVMEYTSPMILLCGVSLLLLFSSMQFPENSRKIIAFFSASSFSTYLIHEHPFIRNLLISSQLSHILLLPHLLQTPIILLSALVIWLLCVILDQIRIALFKLIKIEVFLNNLESLFASLRLY